MRVMPQPDGYYRCSIEGASDADSGRFATAMDELVAPVWDPRWIIPRRVVVAPPTLRGALSVAVDRTVGRVRPIARRPSRGAGPAGHAPGTRRGLRRLVAPLGEPGRAALRAADPAAQRVLELHRGDDPFQVETQLRTLWT